MLSDFFRINLPYGFARNENGEWMAFNREYLPLGYNNMDLKGLPGESYLELPVYTKYKRIPEKLLIELAEETDALERNDTGEVIRIFLYNDKTNPLSKTIGGKQLWDKYFEKVKKLSYLKV